MEAPSINEWNNKLVWIAFAVCKMPVKWGKAAYNKVDDFTIGFTSGSGLVLWV